MHRCVGDWIMFIESNPCVAGCPILAFPVEVLSIDNANSTIEARGDASLLCLDAYNPDVCGSSANTASNLSKMVEQTRTITFNRYEEMRHEYAARDQVCT